MNAKAARLGRQLNRTFGTLVKRNALELPFPMLTRPAASSSAPSRPMRADKLPRTVKRWWASLDHRTRGRARAHWSDGTNVAHEVNSRAAKQAANFGVL
jgi:hypothetical protein